MQLRGHLCATLALICLSMSGCFYHTANIHLEPPSSSQRPELTEEELRDAKDVVEKVASGFGMVSHTNLAWLQRSFEESGKAHLVAWYVSGPKARYENQGVDLSAWVDKKTGEFSVSIVDVSSPWQTDFTAELENAVQQALQKRFLSRKVDVKRWAAGPAFAP